jgi:inosose dehydratase
MSNPFDVSRRRFLQTTALTTGALTASGVFQSTNVLAVPTKTRRDPFHGLKMGITSYTFNKFTLDEAIALTKKAGVKYFSLKDMHLPLKSSPAERQEARKKIEDAGLILMGAGVIYFKNNPEEIRNVFEYVKDIGAPTIICSPDPDALDATEKMLQNFDVRVAIHNHGPGDKKYPSPLDVLKMVKNRDQRMGICMDVGHTVRIGQDPVEVIHKCAKRLYDFHMKDVTEAVSKGKATEVGEGVIDIPAVLKTLVKMKWPFHVALEYEANANAPMPGVQESFAYMRGVLAAID